MYPLLAKAIDRFVIWSATRAMPAAGQFAPRVAEARALLASADYFPETVPGPTDWEELTATDFRFTSGIVSPWVENQVVRGKLFRSGPDWASRPTVLMVHGWNDEFGYRYRHLQQAVDLQALGFNAAMLELPYHLSRRPRRAGAVRDILSEDLFCTIQGAQQAVTDVRTVVSWLQAQGNRQVGLWGVSLGGWFSGLTLCHDPRLAFAVLHVPAARMDEVIGTQPFCQPVRAALAREPLDFTKLTLRSLRPRLPREKILVVEAEDDLFVSKAAIEEFVEAWGGPEIWRYREAHLTGIFRQKIRRRIIGWIAEKTGANSGAAGK